MEKTNTILEELKALYPAVANIRRENFYSVPPNYFDTLPEKILKHIKDDQEQKVLTIPSAVPFKVPGGYFDSLAADILKKAKAHQGNEVADELNEIAPVLNTINKQPVYSVPAGYFEKFKVTTTLSNEVVEELNEIAPLLNTIGRHTVYSVPAGYFNSFKVTTPVSDKRPKLSFIWGGAKIIRLAAAAVITAIIATGSFLLINEKEAPVQVNEPISFKQEQIKNLTDQEIIEYLNSTSSSLDDITRSADENEDNLFENSIEEISDEEIREYLKEYADPVALNKKEG